jgi:hypothetical protein
MKHTMRVIILSGYLSLTPSASGQTTVADDGWEHVKHFHRDRSFIFVDRQFDCNRGKIGDVTDQAISVKRPDQTRFTIERQDLLQITVSWRVTGTLDIRGVLFSGRSSWADVKALLPKLRPYRREKVRVVTLNGKEHSGELIEVDDSHLAVLAGGQHQELAKSDISKVYYITLKQLGDLAEYTLGEDPWLAIFDPEAWPILVGAGRIPVLLYDSSKPEDDSAIICGLKR